MSFEDDEGRKVVPEQKIGAYLCRERESRGLTLEDIALRTKIQRAHLEAIEKDDYAALPAGPFVNGFISSYARTLGLDLATIAPMIPEIQPPPLIDPAAPQDPDWRGPQLEIRELPVGSGGASWATWGIALVVVAVLASVAVWWSPRLQSWLGVDLSAGSILNIHEPESQPDSGVSAASDADGAQVSDDVGEAGESPSETEKEPVAEQPATSDEKPATSSEKVSSARVSDIEASADSAESTDEKDDVDEAESSGDAPRRLAPIVGDDKQVYQVFVDPSQKPGEPLDVEVVALYKTYVRVSTTLGGKPVFESVLQPGEKRRKFSAAGDLWMVIGNGGGAEIYFNGKLLERPGRIGERVGLAFRSAPTP